MTDRANFRQASDLGILMLIAVGSVLALGTAPARAAKFKFGTDEHLVKLQDVEIKSPQGEPLYLGYKYSFNMVFLPYSITDDGYVLGVQGQSRYFKLDDARIKTLQASGQLPSPLPPYALSPLQYAMGYALWGTPLLFAAAIPFTMRQSRRRKRAGAHLEQALAAHHKGDLDGAIYAFTQAADQDPKLATAFHLRGRVYQDKGDSLKAISDYTKALRLEPKLVDVLWDRGMLLRDMRQFETAISDFTRIAKLTKDDSAALLQRGYVHLAKNDLNRAITDFTAVIERAPEYAEAYRYRSLAYERKGQSAAARADAARANAIMGVTGALG